MTVKHLPQTIKQLLTLRSPHALPSPPVSALHALFTRTREDARRRKAENGWLVLTTCTLLTANRPSSLGHLYRFVTRTDPGDAETRAEVGYALERAALLREAALKSVIFVGVPRTILSLAALSEAFEQDIKTSLRKNVEPRRAGTPGNIEATLARGRDLWATIYTPHAEKLHDKLGSYHPDFISFIIQSYGAVLSPLPGAQGDLSRALGSVVGMACLRAEGGVGPQLTSHVFGLLKARDIADADARFPLGAEDRWLATDEGTEWVLRTVDETLDALAPVGTAGGGAKL